MKLMQNLIIGVHPGIETSGIILLKEGRISANYKLDNENLMAFILDTADEHEDVMVIIEDIKPRSFKLRQSTVGTITDIDELEYQLETAKIAFKRFSKMFQDPTYDE
jgi:hypothetical protein